MIKSSLRKKQRDWEWRQFAVPAALAEQSPTAGRVSARLEMPQIRGAGHSVSRRDRAVECK